ncbi:aldehyde dehydrogenase (NADP(+)) [Maribacter sp. 2307ULW6-5]|uniref:aldehyde dehydrogenase (NADP(+)) n=1 Tax=Maribacter sp. 2307ULW6-5 TaxID=3386275 RepID=UPI0039BCE2FC
MTITGCNQIGHALSKKGEVTFRTFDPVQNRETPWLFHRASEAELEEAVGLAHGAFEEYSAKTARQRAEFLEAIAQELEALGNLLVETYCMESGLPQGRALGERGRTMGQLRLFANLIREGSWVEAAIERAQPQREPLPKADIRKMLFPLGPVAVFGASNFPLAFSTAGGDTASALAAGCPVIVKSHPMHAGTGELVAGAIVRAAQRTGMPNGVFSNLNSNGNDVGRQLVMHPKVKAVGFTGSIAGGTALYRMAAERKEPIPVFAEMGSINPVVILPSAIARKGQDWAKAYAGSITMGAGQFCTNPGVLLGLEGTGLESFTEQLSQALEEVVPAVMLHPNIHRHYQEGKKHLLQQRGVKRAVPIKDHDAANTATPTLVTVKGAEFLRNPELHKEVFGPLSIVVFCANAEEMKTILNGLEGQLTGTVLGSPEELQEYDAIVRALRNRVGRLLFNGAPTGVEVNSPMVHGGPFPASTDARFTSVGSAAIKRWARPIAFQDWPNALLPDALKDGNPLQIVRLEEGEYKK